MTPPDRPLVLLADDNPVSREVTAALLEELGWQVTQAIDGAEALARAAQAPFRAILMDCEMPVLDGVEATRRLRAAERERGSAPGIPVIALTGHTQADERERCLAAGMTDFLVKPVGSADLAAALARALDHLSVPSCAGVSIDAPAATDRAKRSAFDPSVILALPMVADGSDPEFAEALLDIFARNARKLLAEFESAVGQGDRDASTRAVHTLKSSAAMIGAPALSDLARALEASLRAAEPWSSGWPALLQRELADWEAAVARWRGGGAS